MHPGSTPILKQRFATTNWSMVLAAGEADSSRSRQALAALCEAYWYPVYAFLRRKGCTVEEARDLAQGYFLELLEKGFLKEVRPEAGRFRSFLLVSVKHFLSNALNRERALKRGGGLSPLRLEFDAAEGRYAMDPADSALTPDRLFERQWAMAVLERAMQGLRDSLRSGDTARFDLLKLYLTGEEPAVPYRQVAAELGLSESAVKVAVHRMRVRFGQVLREVIAQTVASPEEIDDEIRFMLSSLA
jgi:RNA polymerase sigma-70 factor (ECF subfamily)